MSASKSWKERSINLKAFSASKKKATALKIPCEKQKNKKNLLSFLFNLYEFALKSKQL